MIYQVLPLLSIHKIAICLLISFKTKEEEVEEVEEEEEEKEEEEGGVEGG